MLLYFIIDFFPLFIVHSNIIQNIPSFLQTVLYGFFLLFVSFYILLQVPTSFGFNNLSKYYLYNSIVLYYRFLSALHCPFKYYPKHSFIPSNCTIQLLSTFCFLLHPPLGPHNLLTIFILHFLPYSIRLPLQSI